MSDDGPGAREVAYRPFAAEFDDASLSYSESDEERAPNYVVTPTGARVNRLFAVGVLTEVERINEDTRRGRIVDPSGAFITYAGQYQPDAQAFLERATTPSFVALTGKARTFEPEDSDRVFTSVRPESINEVDADTRDRWVVAAAEATLDRLAVFRLAQTSELRGEQLQRALEAGGAPASLAAGVPRALDHYDTTPAYVEAVRRLAVDALELIAGDREEVRRPDVAPNEGGDVTVGPLPETDVTIDASGVDVGTEAGEGDVEAEDRVDTEDDVEAEAEPTVDVGSSTEQDGDDESDPPVDGTEPEPATTGTGPGDVETEPKPSSTETDSDTPTDGEPAAPTDTNDGESDTLGDSADDDLGGSDADEIGDFDDGGLGEADEKEDGSEPTVSDEMYELDDEERDEIESEYGTEFATGSEVDDPGEADIDVPDPEETVPDDPAAEDEPTETDRKAEARETTESGETTESEEAPGSGETTDDAEAAADLDLESVVVETMDELDDGDGADREAVIDDVVSAHGVPADDVEDAIDDALMGGKCYEPSDGVLKAI